MPEKKKLSQKVDKRHRGRVRIGDGPDGKPQYKYIAGRTKAELEAARREVEQQYISGSYIQRDMTFKEYSEKWVTTYKANRLSKSSKDMYTNALYVHLMPTLGSRQMRAIMPSDLQALLNSKAGVSKSLLSQIKSTILQIFTRATAEYIIDRNPSLALDLPEGTQGHRRALTAIETSCALSVGQEHEEGLLLLVLYYLGVRVGEAYGLQWQDVNFNAKTVHVQRDIDYKDYENPIGDVKSTASNRVIPLPTALYDKLSLIKGNPGTHIIQGPNGGYVRQTTAKRRWTRLMVAMVAEDEDGAMETRPVVVYNRKTKKYEPTDQQQSVLTAHYFRHNYATVLYAAGVPVLQARDWLGHADIQTTINIYTHLDKEKAAQNAALLNTYWNKDFQHGCQTVATAAQDPK